MGRDTTGGHNAQASESGTQGVLGIFTREALQIAGTISQIRGEASQFGVDEP